jgi:hypothetical protein
MCEGNGNSNILKVKQNRGTENKNDTKSNQYNTITVHKDTTTKLQTQVNEIHINTNQQDTSRQEQNSNILTDIFQSIKYDNQNNNKKHISEQHPIYKHHENQKQHQLSTKPNNEKETTDDNTNEKMIQNNKIQEHKNPRTKKKPIIDDDKGDMITQKTKNTLRILYQNVNGLKSLNEGKWFSIIEQIKALECDIVGMSEPCINWRIRNIKQQYQQLLSSTFKNSSLIVSTIPTTHDRLYLPGGTTIVTVGSWNSK